MGFNSGFKGLIVVFFWAVIRLCSSDRRFVRTFQRCWISYALGDEVYVVWELSQDLPHVNSNREIFPQTACPPVFVIIIIVFNLTPSRLIVRSGLDVSTFATRRLHSCHHARVPSGGRWNCGPEMSGKFCLNAEFHITFRDLLHAVKLQHGTRRLYFPSEWRRAENFFSLKIRRLRPGANPRTTKGQHATSRPPKPQSFLVRSAVF